MLLLDTSGKNVGIKSRLNARFYKSYDSIMSKAMFLIASEYAVKIASHFVKMTGES